MRNGGGGGGGMIATECADRTDRSPSLPPASVEKEEEEEERRPKSLLTPHYSFEALSPPQSLRPRSSKTFAIQVNTKK